MEFKHIFTPILETGGIGQWQGFSKSIILSGYT